MASRSADGHWNKYNFQLLSIGETQFTPGNPARIRSAASNWGRRYGIWLKTESVKDGCNVTRVAEPIRKSSQRKVETEVRLKRIEDGIRFLSVLVVKMKLQMDKLSPEL